MRRSLRSRHLLVVPKSLAYVLSELFVVYVVEGQRSPPKPRVLYMFAPPPPT